MRKNLYPVILLLFIFNCGQAQDAVRQKTDALAPVILRYYNSSAYDSIYYLGGEALRNAMTQDQFRATMQGVHTQLGNFSSYSFESVEEKVARYKATFNNAVVTLYLSVDEKDKLQTFYLGPYEEKAPAAIARTYPINNPRRTPLDLKVDSVANAFMARNNTVSLAIGVLQNGKMSTYGYGETKKGNNRAPDGKTLYEIGSISKTFTGTLLAYFVLQGKLRIDDPVSKFLPDSIPPIQMNGKPVTLQTLSNHSSGLPRLPANFWAGADGANPYIHYDNNKLFSFLKNFKPSREPGAEYEYSNLAVGLLGVVLERVSGKSYEQLVKEIICRPLKMNNTRITLTRSDSAVFAQGYNGQGAAVHSWEFKSLAAAGGIRSCVDDMLLYANAQLPGSRSSLQKANALAHTQTFQKNDTRVGLGWHIITRDGIEYIFHNGQTGGYFTVLLVNQGTGNAVVMLSNAIVDPLRSAIDLAAWLDK